MSKRHLCYFCIIVMIISIMTTVQACTNDAPQPEPTLPVLPDAPTDSIPPTPQDSIPTVPPDSIPPAPQDSLPQPTDSIPAVPTDTVPETDQGTSPNGISTTINGWNTDDNDNGGRAQ